LVREAGTLHAVGGTVALLVLIAYLASVIS
jgi:hypothetical protein